MIEAPTTMELNCIANPIMRLRLARENGTTVNLDELEKELEMALAFIGQWNAGKKIWWHEFRKEALHHDH